MAERRRGKAVIGVRLPGQALSWLDGRGAS